MGIWGVHKHLDCSIYPHLLISICGFQFRVPGALARVASDALTSTCEEALVWGQVHAAWEVVALVPGRSPFYSEVSSRNNSPCTSLK